MLQPQRSFFTFAASTFSKCLSLDYDNLKQAVDALTPLMNADDGDYAYTNPDQEVPNITIHRDPGSMDSDFDIESFSELSMKGNDITSLFL